ncbi:hypothetical protein HY375_02680 [Candidatus Berkelbacteria bacterium]|nr:hypothetical protein [Candidatus Berkelbacteria bacterium]
MTDANDRDERFYDELDTAKSQGRGSCCSLWSFFLLFGMLLVLGIGLIIWLT